MNRYQAHMSRLVVVLEHCHPTYSIDCIREWSRVSQARWGNVLLMVEEGLYGRCGRRELTGGLCLKDYAQHWSGQGYQRLSEGCGYCLEGKG